MGPEQKRTQASSQFLEDEVVKRYAAIVVAAQESFQDDKDNPTWWDQQADQPWQFYWLQPKREALAFPLESTEHERGLDREISISRSKPEHRDAKDGWPVEKGSIIDAIANRPRSKPRCQWPRRCQWGSAQTLHGDFEPAVETLTINCPLDP